jgi:Arc/MetJ family transcription regulator
MHQSAILMHMRTTLIIDDELIERARKLTGINEKTTLVREGLQALIAREAARRLAALGGTEPDIEPVRRRRAHA